MENTDLAEVVQHPRKMESFQFTGETGEYFRIWIVNIFLSIFTLGIYSAWAKIRNKKYFYANTKFNGSNFDYHAKPIPILKGRIIAAVLFATYAFGPQFHPVFHVIGAVLLAAAIPFFINKGLKFNAGMSSYKNIRFHFRGTLKEAYQIYFRYLFLPIIANIASAFILLYQFIQTGSNDQVGTLAAATVALSALSGLVYLFVFNRLTTAVLNYVYNNLYYGGQKVKLKADKEVVWNNITKPYLKYGAKWVLAIFLLALTIFIPVIGVLAFTVTLYTGIIYMSLKIPFLTTDFVWNNLEFYGSKSESKLEWKKFSGIGIGNVFLVGLGFGLLYPMAKIRMLKYKIESKNLQLFSVEELIAQDQQAPHAVTDEISDAFDFDLSIGF
ncbi:MAG: hypothetical protein CME65_08995 [Halobacteriovoraceae bacterium]|nr:hypothetical protein [Halobacteriovoraceae bacterium]|tara:strand:+ start:2439 stop:3590 length:1152 start_codon:yes stop_codon:yes gene_type:complete